MAANQLKREASKAEILDKYSNEFHAFVSSVTLYEKQSELETKRDSILAEMNAEGTPEQQRERLLEKVKKDNEEIASMERQ